MFLGVERVFYERKDIFSVLDKISFNYLVEFNCILVFSFKVICNKQLQHFISEKTCNN
jgi:hypothetical protein